MLSADFATWPSFQQNEKHKIEYLTPTLTYEDVLVEVFH